MTSPSLEQTPQEQRAKRNRLIVQDESSGWVVVFAAFMTNLLTQGIVYSYGFLFICFENSFGSTRAETSWIASLMCGALYLSGPLASVCIRRYGCRIAASTGSVLSSIGCLLTVFAQNITFMYFSLGLLAGMGYGLIFIPAVVEATIYFKKHRALACGVAASGAGAAAFILSPIMESLLEIYAWRGTLLISSALLLNCLPCSLVFTNRNFIQEVNDIDVDGSGQDLQIKHAEAKDEYNIIPVKPNDRKQRIKEDSKCIINGSVVKNSQIISLNKLDIINCNDDKTVNNLDREIMLQENDKSGTNRKTSIYIKQMSSRSDGSSFLRCNRSAFSDNYFQQVLRNNKMKMFYASQVLFLFGFYIPLLGIPSISREHGIVESKSVWIISIMGISTLIGRIFLGFLSDRSCINRFLLYKVAFVLAGASTCLVPLLTNYAALILYAAVYGSSTAVMLSQTSVVLADIVGLDTISDAMGLNSLFCGIGALVGPPLIGLLYDETGSYASSFIAAGLIMTSGGVLLFFTSNCKAI